MSLKDVIRSITPPFLLNLNRKRKKSIRNKELNNQKEAGKGLSVIDLIKDLKGIGIESGDTLLVHSSLSRLGHLNDGPQTLVNALLEIIGEDGNLLMPTSPNNVYQLNYIQNTPFFDVSNSPSKTGAITEFFRNLEGVKRSLHPTEPVSAYGPKADYFVKDHFRQLTPYNKQSPFYRVAQEKGKILYIGVTLDNAGTSLHTLEDEIENFKYPIYHPQIFDFKVIDKMGESHMVKTKVHNPEWSKKRKCDELIPMFEQEGVLKHVKVGEAKTLLVDAEGFFNTMVKAYHVDGITMYTPNGM